MRNIINAVINTGKFELTDIIRKIDTIWLEGKITDEEKAELVTVAQGKANPQYSMDLLAKVEELDKRVKVLEAQKASEGEVTEEYPAFVEGKWYYTGDKVSFEGSNYTCIAPEGTVCVWSPLAYPAYWELTE